MHRTNQSIVTIGIFNSPENKFRIAKYRAEGLEIVIFPDLIIERIEPDSARLDLLHKLDAFDWLIFADIFSVDNFVSLLEENAVDLFDLDTVRICSVGEAVADRLRFSQIHSDVIPAKYDPQIVLKAIEDYVYDAEEFGSAKFLALTGTESAAELLDHFSRSTAFLTEFPVYRACFAATSELPRLRALLKGGAIDEFVFASPEDVEKFDRLVQTSNFSDLAADIKLTGTDEVTRQALIERKY